MLARLLRPFRHVRRSVGLGFAALVVTVVFGALYFREVTSHYGYTPLMNGEFALKNFVIRKGRKATLRDDIVFLGYDEKSMNLDGLEPEDLENSSALRAIASTQGAWPWPRSVQAMILDRLVDAGARLVIFDLVFLNPNPDDDALRAALDRHRDRVVVGAVYNPERRAVQMPSPTLIPAGGVPDDRVGYVQFFTEGDGLVHDLTYRSTPNDLERDDAVTVYHSLVGQALRKMGRSDLIPADSTDRFYQFRFASSERPRSVFEILRATFNRHIREDAIYGYQPKSVYEIFVGPFWQSNFQNGAAFKDKIVLVGPTANIMQDFHKTPVGDQPGPGIHLHALTAALNGDFLHSTSRTQDLLLIAAAGLVAWGLGVFIRHPQLRFLALLLVGTLYVALVFYCYNHSGLQLVAFVPLLTLGAGGFSGLVGEYVVERAEKARVRGVLDRLVSKDIVRELLGDRGRYAALVRGERRPVTVLFSDVRGFTTLSEAAGDPAAFIAQINEYLGEMADVVFRHRGTLDKFIGDAVMAVWGSMHTEGTEADARAAVRAALEMRVRLSALNARWQAEGKLPFHVGIGLNHGEVIVGGLGSENSKMEITVMGDAVNLASRLEGLTKDYGLDLLVGESVARQVSDAFRLRTVDLVRVKGKKRPAEVMEVLGPLSEVPSEEREILLADYEDAVLLYRRRDFAAAARLLEDCHRLAPDDRLVALYLERCRDLLAQPPAPDWDGVRLMTTK